MSQQTCRRNLISWIHFSTQWLPELLVTPLSGAMSVSKVYAFQRSSTLHIISGYGLLFDQSFFIN